ncbi:MAG: hypothetical protein KGL68_17205 [Burkholderiales bacterium]|nr:hypothetical protein [Burkholderiales bacterium]
MVLGTFVLFCATQAANQWLFSRLQYVPGIDYVYLPAGMRLLCVLLFAEAGALGLLLASWAINFLVQFPGDFERAFAGGILSALAPYLVYRVARDRYGLQESLANLSAGRLLVLALACSVASPLLHHLYFALEGQPHLVHGFLAMFVGDFFGTLIVIYGMKAVLVLLPRRAA